MEVSHNPYFSRWFSAICDTVRVNESGEIVTILILVDGFLQCAYFIIKNKNGGESQSLF